MEVTGKRVRLLIECFLPAVCSRRWKRTSVHSQNPSGFLWLPKMHWHAWRTREDVAMEGGEVQRRCSIRHIQDVIMAGNGKRTCVSSSNRSETPQLPIWTVTFAARRDGRSGDPTVSTTY